MSEALDLTHSSSRGDSRILAESFPAGAFDPTIVLWFTLPTFGVLLNNRRNPVIAGITAIRANHGVAHTLKIKRSGKRAFVMA